MFRYHFLGRFFAELIEICCGSLLNNILKTTEGNFLKHYEYVLTPKNLKRHIFGVFFKKKIIKNYLIFNKTKNASVRFFICLLCVCNFSLHLKKRVWRYMYLGECPKIEYGCHFHGNQLRDFFSPHVFILIIINIQWNDWVEKLAKQFLDQHPPPLRSKGRVGAHVCILSLALKWDKVRSKGWHNHIHFSSCIASWTCEPCMRACSTGNLQRTINQSALLSNLVMYDRTQARAHWS